MPRQILDCGAELRELRDALGSYRKAQGDLPLRRERYSALREEASGLLKRLRPQVELAQVESLRLTSRERVRIQELTEDWLAIDAERASLERESSEARRRLREAESERDHLPAPRDHLALEQSRRDMMELGTLEPLRQETVRRIVESERALENSLKQLGRWSGTLSATERLALPSSATLRAHEERLHAARERHDHWIRSLRESQSAARKIESRLTALRHAAGELPGELDVREARIRRDRLWAVVRHRELAPADARETQPHVDDNDFEHCSTASLVAQFEEALTVADQIVDRIRHEAERVAERASLLAEQDRLHHEQEHAQREQEVASEELRACEHEWSTLWTNLEIQPGTPAEMREWCRDLEQLRASLKPFRDLQAEEALFDTRIANARQQLTQAFEEVQLPPLTAQESLRAALDRGERWIQEQIRLAERQLAVDRQVQKCLRDLEEFQLRKRDIEQRIVNWNSAWEHAVRPLGLPGDTTVTQCSRELEGLDAIFDRLRETDGPEGLGERIAAIERDAREFADNVQRIAAQCEVEVATEIADTAESLLTAERHAVSIRERLAALDKQRQELLLRIHSRRRTVDRQVAMLDALCVEANCDTPDNLENAWRDSEDRRKWQDRLRDVESTLAKFAAESSLEDLDHDALAIDERQAADRIVEL
ncbi:MAG TPA: hypothetical protein VIY86_06315, partial [Pirellulaceae bacterium]